MANQEQSGLFTMPIVPVPDPNEEALTHSPLPASPPQKSTPVAGGSSSSSTTTKSMTQNRKQQAAHRARIVALSKQLTTRLQYATFKVEHGWSKQSLSEVENLYYRHRKSAVSHGAGPSNPSAPTRLSPSSHRKNSGPSTPKHVSRPFGAAAAAPTTKYSSSGQEIDVFGGLVTPPASGGAFPVHAERDPFTGPPSFSSGRQQRSPTAGLEGKGGGGSANKGGKSYADFWSKIGTPGPAQSGAGQGGGDQQ